MSDSRQHPLDRIATALLALCWLGLLVFLAVSESFRGFCHELARLGGKLLTG